jgi:hypothetical protein
MRNIANTPEGIYLECSDLAGLRIGLQCTVRVDGEKYTLVAQSRHETGGDRVIRLAASGSPVELAQTWSRINEGWCVSNQLTVTVDNPVTLGEVEFLSLPPDDPIQFPETACHLDSLVESAYEARMGPMFPTDEAVDACSNLFWVVSNRETGDCLLIGFVTQDRWTGRILYQTEPGNRLSRWSVRIDGCDTLVQRGGPVHLEDFVVIEGTDGLDLLDRYGDLVNERHTPDLLQVPPVTWCSWYPHRLGVSSERVLANARVARDRLADLGLDTFVVDLGWEKEYLPSLFEENDQFPGGFRALSDGLRELGFHLGTWSAPTTISEFDPLVTEHPEYLCRNEQGEPDLQGKWYWHPHGRMGILDLTHPGAQEWLYEKIRSLAQRGSAYLKADFVGNVASGGARNRFDARIVPGAQTGRIAARVMRDAMREVNPDAVLLNCAGPEIPGPTQADLLYTCNDTGNTGYVGWHHLRTVFLTTAIHLFKNHRWGIIQPSCLCIGLPGILAEARTRATVAFLSAGQIDVGDDLTTLPEDRWRVLTSTLPVPERSARAIDLFSPIARRQGGYSTQDTDVAHKELPAAPRGTLWALPVETDWDRWTLAAVFDYSESESEGDRSEAQLQTCLVPLDRLGFATDSDVDVFEFWSGQFAGTCRAEIPPQPDYTHPGDMQNPIQRTDEDTLRVSFFGPGVMLLAIREARQHPWVAGTSFHQSCGSELSGVSWDGSTLSGEITRPVGESGSITISGINGRHCIAQIDGRPVPVRPGAGGSVILPVVTTGEPLEWRLSLA